MKFLETKFPAMRKFFYFIFLISLFSLTGCKDNSADDRLRRFLSIPSNQEVTEATVSKRVIAILPIGTSKDIIDEKVQEIGIGKDKLSSYNIVKGGELLAIRVDFDPTTFGVTKSTWIISLRLDAEQRLKAVSAKRYVTGL